MSLHHRRRKASAEELAQGERGMQAAQQRLDRELKQSGELAIEDGEGNGAGKERKKDPIHQTPSTTGAPPTEESSKVTARTPDTKAPKSGRGTPAVPKAIMPLVETHTMATPPTEESLPLFTRDQIAGLHEMYQQAPWLHSRFETPNQFSETPLPSVHRPTFLAEEEKSEEEAKKVLMLRRLEEKAALERFGKGRNDQAVESACK